MKVVLVLVSSIDGKVTKWGDPDVKKWSSVEDKEHFRNVWRESKLIVVGSNSFKAEHLSPSPKRLILVLTHKPDIYVNLQKEGQLEFTDESPRQLTDRLRMKGYEQMTLLGGPSVAASFLRENLVDELWLTIEPVIFGKGEKLFSEDKFDIKLKLISMDKVNEQGTLLIKYSIQRKKG
jgi:dihydrofolate reductase